MKQVLRRHALFLWPVAAAVFGFQRGPETGSDLGQDQGPDVKLPNGKSQRDEILKLERQENIKDAGHLVDLAQSLKADLEKDDRFVLSMGTLKKTDDIEKLVKKIRSRLRH